MIAVPTPRSIPAHLAHPLDPLSSREIRLAVGALRSHVQQGAESAKPIEKILFNSISLIEPNKYAVLLWAGTFTEKQIRAAGGEIAPLIRQAEVSALR